MFNLSTARRHTAVKSFAANTTFIGALLFRWSKLFITDGIATWAR